jgi:DNA-binding NarL/FixJ family response regulator
VRVHPPWYFETFDAVGARPWADQAACELAATGQHDAPRSDAEVGLEVLTPQELKITRIVADGLNNVEAGAVLYLSRKTVEAHLTRVYRKLGLRSLTDLARVPGSGRAESASGETSSTAPGRLAHLR